jgi:hypothetical protein
MKNTITLAIILLCFISCSDTVRTEFATLDIAKNSGAFERGWLPPALPVGTTQIVEINDLDLNTGEGTFCFPVDSIFAYLELMKTEFNATIAKDSNRISLDVKKGKTIWTIYLKRNKGSGEYFVGYKK